MFWFCGWNGIGNTPVFWFLLISTCTVSRLSPFPFPQWGGLVDKVLGAETARTDDSNWSQGYSLSCNIMISNKHVGTGRSQSSRASVYLQEVLSDCLCITPSFAYKTVFSAQKFFLLLLHSTGIGSAQTKVRVVSCSLGSTEHRKLHVYSLSAFQTERELHITWYYSKLFCYKFKKDELTPNW